MILVRKPSEAEVGRFLDEQAQWRSPYSGPLPGDSGPPFGYEEAFLRVKIGEGDQTFAKAQSALMSWKVFELGWVALHAPSAVVSDGAVVGILAQVCGLWFLNACRVISVNCIDNSCASFVYEALPDHSGEGVESFLVEQDPETGEVWYEIRSISKPRNWLAKLTAPYFRFKQKQFRQESADAMWRAIRAR